MPTLLKFLFKNWAGCPLEWSKKRALGSNRSLVTAFHSTTDMHICSARLLKKEAAICFRLVEGRMDYAGFCGKDSIFLNWVKDLFLYYWDKGKRAYCACSSVP